MSWHDVLSWSGLDPRGYDGAEAWLRGLADELDAARVDAGAPMVGTSDRHVTLAAVLRHWTESPIFAWTKAAEYDDGRSNDGTAVRHDGTGRRMPAWTFARALWWSSELARLSADDAWGRVLDVLATVTPPETVDHADEDMVAEFAFGIDHNTVEADFNNCWGKLETPYGLDRPRFAYFLAQRHPVEFDHTARIHRKPEFQAFIGMAAYLQVLKGEGLIYLPCRNTGRIIGEERQTVANWINRAQAAGLLTHVTDSYYGPGKTLAAMKRFNLDRVRGLASWNGPRSWHAEALEQGGHRGG